MKILLILATAFTLTACQSTGTPEQQARRGKNVAELESIGWNVLGFTARLTESFLINSATNLAREQGFRK